MSSTPASPPLAATELDPDRVEIAAAVASWGDAASSTWLESLHKIWKAPSHTAESPVVQGYLERKEWAFAWGDPVVKDRDLRLRLEAARGFVEFIQAKGGKPVYCCITEELEHALADELGWSALTCIKEDKLPTDHLDLSNNDVQKNIRRSTRAGIEVISLNGPPTGELKTAIEAGLLEWERAKKSSLAAQALQPWIDAERRRYWVALQEGKPLGLAVLAPIGGGGFQIKDCIPFPSAPKGVSEHLISTLLEDLKAEGVPSVTFGISAKQDLVPVDNLNGWKVTFLSKAYKRVLSTTGITKRGDFRAKFNVEDQPLYISYPSGGLGWDGIKALLKVLKRGSDMDDDYLLPDSPE